jgi:signal peptidase II
VTDSRIRPAGAGWIAAGAVAGLVIALDQASKALVAAARPAGDGGGIISVRLVRNTGASFGIGSGHPVIVVLVSVIIIAVVVALLARTRGRAMTACLALVLGGAVSNLADRLVRGPGLGHGGVIDWIHVWGYPATFNLADVAIRVGAVGAAALVLGLQRLKWPRLLHPCRAGQ